jgi:hypothetical protein
MISAPINVTFTTETLATMAAAPAAMTAADMAAEMIEIELGGTEVAGAEVVEVVDVTVKEDAIFIGIWICAIDIGSRVIVGRIVCSAGHQAKAGTDQQQDRYHGMLATNHRDLLQLLSSCSSTAER